MRLGRVKSPNIVNVLGVSITSQKIQDKYITYILMEGCNGGTLDQWAKVRVFTELEI